MEPEFVELAAPFLKPEAIAGGDWAHVSALAELGAGLFAAARRWSSDAGAAAAVLPFFKALFLARGAEAEALVKAVFAPLVGDCDVRRVRWVLDIAVELVAGDEASLAAGLAAFRMVGWGVGPFGKRLVVELFMEKVWPRVRSVKALGVQLVDALGSFVAALFYDYNSVIRYSLAPWEQFWTDIFDVEFAEGKEQMARFLSALDLHHGGFAPELKWIAPRLERLWSLSSDVTPDVEKIAVGVLNDIATMEWGRNLEALGVALAAADSVLTSASAWRVQVEAARFVVIVMQAWPWALDTATVAKMWSCIEAMAGSKRAEVRDRAVDAVEWLLPVCGGAVTVFGERVKSGPLGIACALALLRVIDVLQEIQAWASGAFQFLEQQHAREPLWAKAIEQGFTKFWSGIGHWEIPDLDDYRYVFAGSYYA